MSKASPPLMYFRFLVFKKSEFLGLKTSVQSESDLFILKITCLSHTVKNIFKLGHSEKMGKISLIRSLLLFVGLIAVIFLQDKGASARNILNRPGSGNRIRQEKLFHSDLESDHNDIDGDFTMDSDSDDFDIPAGFGHPHLGLGLDSWGGLREEEEKEDLGAPDAQMRGHLKRKRAKRLANGERKDRAKPKPGCCYCGDHLCCDTMCHGK